MSDKRKILIAGLATCPYTPFDELVDKIELVDVTDVEWLKSRERRRFPEPPVALEFPGLRTKKGTHRGPHVYEKLEAGWICKLCDKKL